MNIIPAVVHAFHGVQDASLHGFETIGQMRHGAFQYDVRGIIQEPVLVHAVQVMSDAILHRNIIGHYASIIR